MTTDEIGDLVRLLAADTPLGLLSDMQARTVFQVAQQRGYRITPPAEPMICRTCQASQETRR
jgi:hypothetical protein